MTVHIFGNVVENTGCARLPSGVDNPGTIGDQVRIRRNEQNLSQAELGEMLGVDGQTISNLETGKTKTLKTAESRRKLVEFLSSSPFWTVKIPLSLRASVEAEAAGTRMDADEWVEMVVRAAIKSYGITSILMPSDRHSIPTPDTTQAGSADAPSTPRAGSESDVKRLPERRGGK